MLKNLHKFSGLLLILGCLSCNQLTDTFKDTFKEDSTDNKKEENAPTASTVTSSSSSITIETRIHRDTVRVSSRSNDKQTAFLADEAALQAAEAKLKALPAYAGKKMYLYDDIHVYDDGRINLQLRHPSNPEYVDKYQFEHGQWSGPEPVQLSVRDKVDAKLVPLDGIDFKAIANVYRNLVEKSATIEGAKPPTHIYGVIHEKRFSWYPRSISGSRERYAISFRLDGSVDQFFRE
ncbi:hypothetical protein [Chitinophaga qingshengii]|uniref:Beta-lactamase-inhibitor-like PepSY-like domain-containing protein n=1 Tax=Chitinophaga qingshengii TaxID=1569794 RepID=A0ABR7TTR0_9BACT|nr:hypothetical protein [Chitinophaga qingshengii]MBC9933860.1 hypothetical protein [Chitinophaga qingshengii]